MGKLLSRTGRVGEEWAVTLRALLCSHLARRCSYLAWGLGWWGGGRFWGYCFQQERTWWASPFHCLHSLQFMQVFMHFFEDVSDLNVRNLSLENDVWKTTERSVRLHELESEYTKHFNLHPLFHLAIVKHLSVVRLVSFPVYGVILNSLPPPLVLCLFQYSVPEVDSMTVNTLITPLIPSFPSLYLLLLHGTWVLFSFPQNKHESLNLFQKGRRACATSTEFAGSTHGENAGRWWKHTCRGRSNMVYMLGS